MLYSSHCFYMHKTIRLHGQVLTAGLCRNGIRMPSLAFLFIGAYILCPPIRRKEVMQNGIKTVYKAATVQPIKYQKEKFGNTSYYDFAKQFKAELFNPDEWANLFEQSGAKYIVLTSKHHDGFCLWPSEIANETWGFSWNAAHAGPHRDLRGGVLYYMEIERVFNMVV